MNPGRVKVVFAHVKLISKSFIRDLIAWVNASTPLQRRLNTALIFLFMLFIAYTFFVALK
jgi:hypothetical protein